MDKNLLSSPHLHSLDNTAYTCRLLTRSPSELHAFKSCLLQARNLRLLTLRMTTYRNVIGSSPPDLVDGEVNLQFSEHDHFPALQELVLDCYDVYYLSAPHCETWVKAMDWTRLRSLDLGHATPQYLLPALSGKIPGLLCLTMGWWPNHNGPQATWRSPDLDTVRRFLEGIDALERVTLYSWNDKEASQIRPSLLEKHGKSLKRLEARLDFRDAWKSEHFDELLEKAPNLQELTVTGEIWQVRRYPGERSAWVRS